MKLESSFRILERANFYPYDFDWSSRIECRGRDMRRGYHERRTCTRD